MKNQEQKIRLGYLDEDIVHQANFFQHFKDEFDVIILDVSQLSTIDRLLDEIDRLKIQALVVDYRLADSGKTNYNGDEVIKIINEKKCYFPVIMMTAFIDPAIEQVNDPFWVNGKEVLENPDTERLLKKKIKYSVEHYNQLVEETEQRTRELEDKQDSEEGLSLDEEKELLNLHIELNKIDPEANPLSPEMMQTSAVKDLRKMVLITEDFLKKMR